MPRYVSVLLPLAVTGSYTYSLPEEMAEQVEVGSRVVVQFGQRRYYTGIVTALHEENPQPGVRLKPVTDLLDSRPVLLPAQLRLWQWMAHYYMCTEGEVMKAALPAGLKIGSETKVALAEESDAPDALLSGRERQILSALEAGKACDIQSLEKKLGMRGLIRSVRRLVEAGTVRVCESVVQTFKPRTETRVRLASSLFSEAGLHEALDKLRRAPAQEALLLRYLDLSAASAALSQNDARLLAEVAKRDLCASQGSEAALAALRKKGLLEVYQAETARLREEAVGHTSARPICLSEAQQRAYDEILASFAEKEVCLLHGVTSSGKTEVYSRLIREALAQGRQVLYLVPEIALTTQLTSRLSRLFGGQMGVYHSKFPDNERVELWQRQLSPQPFPLIVGVRSSLFLPFRNLGLVIVDEEHETSYKQQDPAPRYGARDTAVVLAHACGAKVLLGSATPSFESYRNAMRGKYGIVRLAVRYGDVRMPEIVVEDVKELRRKKLMKSPFSPRLTDEVRRAVADRAQAILFQNRRGYSPVLQCRACGWTPRCSRCDVSLTYHRHIGKIVCHYCGATYDVPRSCPACDGTELRDIGYGTEKIEAAAQVAFPDAHTERMDLDTTRSRAAYEQIISRFERNETNLLIGTQMVTKGLDFDRVRVVGVLNADQMLNQPDFRAHERAFQMMAQVAGRAGRRGSRGLVVLQTGQPDHPVIAQVAHDDYEGLYRSEIAEREAYHYPPFYRLIHIHLKHRDEAVVAHAAEHLAALLRRPFGADLLGPDRPLVSRVQLLHLRKIMVKLSPRLSSSWVRQTLLEARADVLAFGVYKGVHIYFDVDP